MYWQLQQIEKNKHAHKGQLSQCALKKDRVIQLCTMCTDKLSTVWWKKKTYKQTDRQLPMAAGSKNYRAPNIDMRTDASDIKRSYEFALAHPSAERLCPFHLRARCRTLGCICVFLLAALDLRQHITQFKMHSAQHGSEGTANTAAYRKISSFPRFPRTFPHDNTASVGSRR